MRAAAILVIALIAIAPLQLHGQVLTPAQVEELRAAKHEVFVQLAGTPIEIHGRLAGFDATALTMEVEGRSFTFPSNDVLRIEIITRKNRNGLVRGALIGGLATAAWCALVCGQGLEGKDPPLAAVVFANGSMGAAIGGLIGFTREARKTIYKSAGSGAAISRRANELPCPATPLVLEADLSPIDLRRLPKTWTPVPQSQVFGASRCDGVTIQRHYDRQTGVWQPGVEIAAGPVDARWIAVRVRVTVRNPKGGRDKEAHVDIGLRQDGGSQVTSICSIAADADEENSGDVVLHVPRALLSPSLSGLSLQVTLTTSYAR